MKTSYNWLNNFLNNKADEPEKISEILTMNSMEVEDIEKVGDDFVLDIKTTPNINHSCLCHRGIAREVAVLSGLRANKYSREYRSFDISNTKNKLLIKIENPKLCRRYIGRIIENVKIGKSPSWLSEKLEAIGQRSINNIVDATNYIMFEIGQPLHVFDADKLVKGGIANIEIKNAKAGSVIKTLDSKDISLDENVLLITDGENPLAIAGVKGGTFAEIEDSTTNIILESANFEPTNIRKTAQRLKIQTDASKRFENDFSPLIADEAMDILTSLIIEIAQDKGTTVGEKVDVYPRRANKYKVGISTQEAKAILGIDISDTDIENIFNKFEFKYEKVRPIDKVITLAKDYIGVPYKLGASVSYDAPKYFDCSGFIAYLYAQAGVQIPRVSGDQYAFADKVKDKEIKAGDIIFINTGVGKIYTETFEFLPGKKLDAGVDHCALYLGDNKIIHASSKNGVVAIEDISIFDGKIVGCGRVSENTERFVVTIPDERLDLRIKEDLAEEIGRVYGYENIKDIEIPSINVPIIYNKTFYYSNKIRNILNDLGFSEVYTYSFVKEGEYEVANAMAQDKRFLRTDLAYGMVNSLELNARYSEVVEMLQIKIFEIGNIFNKDGERLHLSIGVKSPVGVKNIDKDSVILQKAISKIEEQLSVKLKKINKEENIAEFDLTELIDKLPDVNCYDMRFDLIEDGARYSSISAYPFILRDIAVFIPEGESEEKVAKIIKENATDLLLKMRLFDVFTKEMDGKKKTSYAYRLVFQSQERTLSDDEINKIMEKITEQLNSIDGYIVR